MEKILVVEDHFWELKTLLNLLGRKYEVVPVMSLAEAREKLEAYTFDLVLTDLMLPDGDGLELVEELHDEKYRLPILILSGKGSSEEKTEGLRSGGDDYVVKPLNADELMLRVENLLNKQKMKKEEVLEWGGFCYYPGQHRVTIGEKLEAEESGGDFFERALTPKVAKVLECLMRRAGQIVNREQIYDVVWQQDGENGVDLRTIDVVLRRLRNSLGEYGRYVRSVRGVGYQLMRIEGGGKFLKGI